MKFCQYTALSWVILGGLLFSCQEDDASNVPELPSVELANDATFGQYLADQDGRTLYYFSQDVNGSSACRGNCTDTWSAFSDESLMVGEGLEETDFSSIVRENGTQQITYKGWPLYRYQGDDQSGEINGDGEDEQWFVAKPDYSVMLAHQVIEGLGDTLSQYIVDPEGRTLYYHIPDEQNISNCEVGCIEERPVFFGGENLIVPSGLGLDKFDIIVRNDGTKQSSYKKRAMYRYIQDDIRGTVLSHKAVNWTIARVSWAKPGG